MQMAVEKPNPLIFNYKFQEIFNSGIFSELTEHTESKMIIFTKILYTVTKEVDMIDMSRPPKLRFCLDTFVLKVAYEIS